MLDYAQYTTDHSASLEHTSANFMALKRLRPKDGATESEKSSAALDERILSGAEAFTVAAGGKV